MCVCVFVCVVCVCVYFTTQVQFVFTWSDHFSLDPMQIGALLESFGTSKRTAPDARANTEHVYEYDSYATS